MDNTSIQEKKSVILKTRRRGDIAIVCKQVGFSVTIFWTAMKRTDTDYTDAELKVIEGMYRKMLERLELRQRVGLFDYQ